MIHLRVVILAVIAIGCFVTLLDVSATSYSLADNTTSNRRQKRNSLPLVFPSGGTSKLLLGFAMPIKNPANVSLIFALNFQYQYAVPPNITFFSKYYPYVTVSRRKRDLQSKDSDRNVFYKAVESTMDGFGVNGKECLLRTICEAAEAPVHQNGLIGELMHLLLTPTYHDSLEINSNDEAYDYNAAHQAGKQMYDCRGIYPECPLGHGVFDLISVLH